jgi:anti-anti-sigma factor
VEPGDTGTTARIRHQVYRRGQLLGTGAGTHPAHGPESRLLLILDAPDDVVRVDGPIDAVTAEQLRRELLHRSRGGTRPVTVDLTGVTHLASAGVAVLHYVAGRHRQHGTRFEVSAAPGTVAQQILSLVGLAGNTANRR